MGNMIGNVQERFKTSTVVLLLWIFKFFTGLFTSLTLALIGEEIIDYGGLSFMLVTVTLTAAFLRISRRWTWLNVLIFNLICVLIGLLLRMYILIAPG